MKSSHGRGERGDIMVVFLLALAPLLLAIGLAVDLGSAYVAHANMANAVDAGALAALRASGTGDMNDIALKVAKTNYNQNDSVAYTYSMTNVGNTGVKVELRADYEAPAYFSRLFGNENFSISSVATAMRFPIDLSFVIDTTQSLKPQGVFNDLKNESKAFLEYFDENADRVGIVSFATIAVEEMNIRTGFVSPGQTAIHKLKTMIDTNMEQALLLAKQQLDAAPVRPEARRFVLIVTDGRPTAFLDNFDVPYDPPNFYTGIVAADDDAFAYRGLFVPEDGRRVKFWKTNGNIVTAANSSSTSSPVPAELPGGLPVVDPQIRNIARQRTEDRATLIRQDGVAIYVVAILPPNPGFPLDTPDLEMLRRVANENGIADADQPQGQVFWSGPDDLETMYAEVAGKMLVAQLVDE